MRTHDRTRRLLPLLVALGCWTLAACSDSTATVGGQDATADTATTGGGAADQGAAPGGDAAAAPSDPGATGADPGGPGTSDTTGGQDLPPAETTAGDLPPFADTTTPPDAPSPDTGDPDTGGPDTSSSGPQLVLSDPTLRDDDGDGRWSPGEGASVTVIMTNVGDEPHNRYPSARLSTSTEGVTVTQGSFELFGLFAGDSQEMQFRVEAHATTAADTEVAFVAIVSELNCEESFEGCPEPNPIEFSFTLQAAPGPRLVLSDPTLRDAGDDGVWSPGEGADVTVIMTNVGDEPHNRYPSARLSTSTAGVTVTQGSWELFGIFPGDSQEMPFRVETDASIAPGTTVSFQAIVSELNCEDSLEGCPDPNPLDFTFDIGSAP